MAYLWSRRESAEAVRFCAEYALPAPPDTAALEGLDGAVPGLICNHWVEQNGRPRVHLVSYWKDRSAYDQERSELERRLGVSAPSYEGVVRHLQIKPAPPHRRFLERLRRGGHWGRNVLAILGAGTTLMPVYLALYASPRVIARLDCPRNVVAEELFAGKVALRNERRRWATVKLVTLEATPGATAPKPIALDFDPQPESIGALGERELPFEGRLRTDGSYDLTGDVEAESGLFKRRQTFPVHWRLVVWPALPKVMHELAAAGAGGSALLTGRLWLGPAAPDGVKCTALIRPRPGASVPSAAAVRCGAVRSLGVKTWDDEPQQNASGGWTGSSITWTSPQLPQFAERRFSIELEAAQPIDWSKLVTEVVCQF